MTNTWCLQVPSRSLVKCTSADSNERADVFLTQEDWGSGGRVSSEVTETQRHTETRRGTKTVGRHWGTSGFSVIIRLRYKVAFSTAAGCRRSSGFLLLVLCLKKQFTLKIKIQSLSTSQNPLHFSQQLQAVKTFLNSFRTLGLPETRLRCVSLVYILKQTVKVNATTLFCCEDNPTFHRQQLQFKFWVNCPFKV